MKPGSRAGPIVYVSWFYDSAFVWVSWHHAMRLFDLSILHFWRVQISLIKSLTFRSVSLHDTFKDPSISKIHKLFLLECPSSLSIFNFIEPISVHSSLFSSLRDWFSAFNSFTHKFISSILSLIEEKSFLTSDRISRRYSSTSALSQGWRSGDPFCIWCC